MEEYIGINVHARSSTSWALNASGNQLRRDLVEINREALIGCLKWRGEI
ncbi:MAG: hypothetical protein KJ970_15205 [Candidatus Eisenbacteria bacterium]|uniref:Uncharacterized protein n=1 Tax=Eiseniibacteriota bacterium TaxID=2212470 RepID=A0A948S1S9_UNCEI|nr:hypothetical protein [Candidatus Eisenbacteria bacterium]MBU2692269.1 hypothetical protein [Candidatus Eisenbacteria bacterium]